MNIAPINQSNYIRRRIFSAVMDGVCTVAALFSLVILGLILTTLVQKGLAGLSPSLFTEPMKTPGNGGGLANAIVGTLIQTGLGILVGAPLGMAVGVYLSEVGRNSRLASAVRFVNDILLSAPSVLVGLFVYQIVVVPTGGFSGFAGSIALALLAMPVIARTTEDIMKLVPESYREGSLALGARDSTTIIKVVLPAAFGGILTGILLAVARISGETAPLIFTSLGSFNFSSDLMSPMASLPIAIYRYASSPYGEWVDLAWAGALVITVGVLTLNVLSRLTYHWASNRR
ncbi:MAG: phosphate ABC transporter permease PstA [Hyphomonadaceae bacterium]|nr:phosphate ABC transporter permease PstA [Hyphomonadaceae bacterium]